MYLNRLFCSYSNFTGWLQNHLLACPFKKLTGFDCPGCGFQRSLIALLQGDVGQSVHYYPATLPFMLTVTYTLVYKRINLENREFIKNMLYILTGLLIAGSYAFKLGGYAFS